jgi:hypothetical protein
MKEARGETAAGDGLWRNRNFRLLFGAQIVAFFGVRYVFRFDAFTYLASALLVVLAAIPHGAKDAPPLSPRIFLSEITHGTRVLLREPSLRQALTLSFAEATAGAVCLLVTAAALALGRGDGGAHKHPS